MVGVIFVSNSGLRFCPNPSEVSFVSGNFSSLFSEWIANILFMLNKREVFTRQVFLLPKKLSCGEINRSSKISASFEYPFKNRQCLLNTNEWHCLFDLLQVSCTGLS